MTIGRPHCVMFYAGLARALLPSRPDANTFRSEIKTPLVRSSTDDCAIRLRSADARRKGGGELASCKWPSHKIEYMCRRRELLQPRPLFTIDCIQLEHFGYGRQNNISKEKHLSDIPPATPECAIRPKNHLTMVKNFLCSKCSKL